MATFKKMTTAQAKRIVRMLPKPKPLRRPKASKAKKALQGPATARKRHTVCGVPVRLGRPKRQVLAGGLVASISKAEAKRLLQTLFGRTTLPRPGHQTRLCGDQWLDNTSGRFAVDRRRDSSGFEGVKPRRRRRRR